MAIVIREQGLVLIFTYHLSPITYYLTPNPCSLKPKCIIIDDSIFITEVLADQIRELFPAMEVSGVAHCGNEGLKLIRAHNPDLVFLDVEMPDMTGFEMLAQLSEISFRTIFITSHSHYAIKAIRFNALDYLLKPIEHFDLMMAVERFVSGYNKSSGPGHIKQALANMKVENAEDMALFLNTQDGELKLYLRDIVRVEGERNYSFIYLTDGTKHLSSRTLGYFNEMLSDKGFFRCHRSHLVNKIHIGSMNGKSSFELKSGEYIPVSRRKGSEAKEWFRERNDPE